MEDDQQIVLLQLVVLHDRRAVIPCAFKFEILQRLVEDRKPGFHNRVDVRKAAGPEEHLAHHERRVAAAAVDVDQAVFRNRVGHQRSGRGDILRLLRPDGRYTELEAKVLDIALIIHAEHGGGNNSTFTTHVVTSTGTDTYSAIAASLGSLKGPKHGGANLKVQQMFKDIEEHVTNWDDDDEVTEYLTKILNREAFDGKGLIYGIGHAVYTESDPRCVILKKYAQALSNEKGLTKEFELYNRVEGIAIKLMQQHRQLFKPICANVDFYSGFVYTMLGLPMELFTPIFAISRISGWCAHRIEELANEGKIIRPAYKYVGHHKDYVAIEDRWW